MNDLNKYLEKQLNGPAFRAEYEAQRPEFEAVRAVIAAEVEAAQKSKL